MNYEAAKLCAEQLMQEIGKSIGQYHHEPVIITGTKKERSEGKIVIHAYNEVYILLNRENYFGMYIVSENSVYDTDEPSKSGVPEFTGMIEIIKKGIAWSIEQTTDEKKPSRLFPVEFLRVVIY